MNSIVQLTRASLPLGKELLWPKNWCRQIVPIASYSSQSDKKPSAKPKEGNADPKDDVEIPQNVHPYADKYLSSYQEGSGEVYDTKPFKIRLKPNKEYFWCLCGRSHSQPLCDGTHRDAYRKTPYRPVRFQVKEDKEYWLCNCKKTKLRPFCDGTHKTLPPKKR